MIMPSKIVVGVWFKVLMRLQQNWWEWTLVVLKIRWTTCEMGYNWLIVGEMFWGLPIRLFRENSACLHYIMCIQQLHPTVCLLASSACLWHVSFEQATALKHIHDEDFYANPLQHFNFPMKHSSNYIYLDFYIYFAETLKDELEEAIRKKSVSNDAIMRCQYCMWKYENCICFVLCVMWSQLFNRFLI